MGSLASQALYVAAKLGIADLLADGPKTILIEHYPTSVALDTAQIALLGSATSA
jgi:hypothetical protein